VTPEPSVSAMVEELAKASAALSRASAVAVDPYRSLVGALLDMTTNLQGFILGAHDVSALFDGKE
jgi:hypothetical protein